MNIVSKIYTNKNKNHTAQHDAEGLENRIELLVLAVPLLLFCVILSVVMFSSLHHLIRSFSLHTIHKQFNLFVPQLNFVYHHNLIVPFPS